MSKFLQLTWVLVAGAFLFSGMAKAQINFSTGKMAVELDNFGQIEVFASTLDTIQIDRASLLVGTGPNAVFDYLKDAESVQPASVVPNPQLSDFELRVWCDNTYSNEPPNILEKLYMYGWNNAGYSVGRIKVINTDPSAINAYNGLEVLPQIDGQYGFESVAYLAAQQVVSIYKSGGNTYVGFQFFNPALASLRSFEWFDGYNDLDDSLWVWLTYGAIDPLYNSGIDGSVAIFGQAPVAIASGDSVEFFFGIAVGDNESDMLANMQDARQKYEEFFTGISLQDPAVPANFELGQNYPNPFNPSTRIDFQLAEKRNVSLKVYNLLGEAVATLVNENLAPGRYTYEFSANNLPSGLYFYTLSAGDFRETRKMMLLK